MNKVRYSVFGLGTLFLSLGLSAEMKKTEECNIRIEKFQRQIKACEESVARQEGLSKAPGALPFVTNRKKSESERERKRLRELRSKLEAEKSRLRSGRIFLRSIEISADTNGKWDPLSRPDIVVKKDGRIIARGNKDECYMYYSFADEEIEMSDELKIYDEDVGKDDSMGDIWLKKNVRMGVEGDSYIETEQGEATSSGGEISYKVEYEVSY